MANWGLGVGNERGYVQYIRYLWGVGFAPILYCARLNKGEKGIDELETQRRQALVSFV